ncbi:mucin-2-like, partial [Microcaecilia unicolor]|uniref:Mucin-2-like n=1 Tax=Microcaecilia unicolor TaxID=1415580 RepID=A0A6P7YZT5_9AMPH
MSAVKEQRDTFEHKMFADKNCPLLQEGEFAACHSTVDYQKYQERCKYVTCTSNNVIASLCNSFENYAEACRDSEVPISNWTTALCQQKCDGKQQFKYNMNPCKLTCQSLTYQSN